MRGVVQHYICVLLYDKAGNFLFDCSHLNYGGTYNIGEINKYIILWGCDFAVLDTSNILALASSLHPIKVWRMKAISRQGMQG
jgi:hypothetical protein